MKLYPSLSEAHVIQLPLIMEALDTYVDGYHIDIMDGNFVTTISWGLALVKVMANYTKKPLWLHFMVTCPEQLMYRYVDKKHTYIVSIHQETITDWLFFKKYKKNNGVSLGLAINPETDLTKVIPYIEDIDHVLIMSVQPGFSGQLFLNNAWNKIEQARKLCAQYNAGCMIAVDGGVTIDHIIQLKHNKVGMIAAFSAIFGGGFFEKSYKKGNVQDDYLVQKYIEKYIENIKRIRAV